MTVIGRQTNLRSLLSGFPGVLENPENDENYENVNEKKGSGNYVILENSLARQKKRIINE